MRNFLKFQRVRKIDYETSLGGPRRFSDIQSRLQADEAGNILQAGEAADEMMAALNALPEGLLPYRPRPVAIHDEVMLDDQYRIVGLEINGMYYLTVHDTGWRAMVEALQMLWDGHASLQVVIASDRTAAVLISGVGTIKTVRSVVGGVGKDIELEGVPDDVMFGVFDTTAAAYKLADNLLDKNLWGCRMTDSIHKQTLKSAYRLLHEGKAGFSIVPNISAADAAEVSAGGTPLPTYVLFAEPSLEFESEWEEVFLSAEPLYIKEFETCTEAAEVIERIMNNDFEIVWMILS